VSAAVVSLAANERAYNEFTFIVYAVFENLISDVDSRLVTSAGIAQHLNDKNKTEESRLRWSFQTNRTVQTN
jgi:hypothetical protein